MDNGRDSVTRNTPLVAAAAATVAAAAAVDAAAAAVAHVGRCARHIAPTTTARSSRLARCSRASASRGLARSSPARRGRGRAVAVRGELGERRTSRRLLASAGSHPRAGATGRRCLIGGCPVGDGVARGLCCFGTDAALVTQGFVLVVFFFKGGGCSDTA